MEAEFWGTALIVVILVIICVIGVRSYIKKLAHGCCGGGGGGVKRIRPADRDAAHYPYIHTLGVDGMTCKNCAARVENAFNRRDGFWASVDLKKATAVVRSKQPVTEEELEAIVLNAGYTVRSVEVK